MKNKIKLFLLSSSVFAMVYWSGCTPDDIKPPQPIPCDVLYPKNVIIEEPQPTFTWCSVNEALIYHVQIGDENTFTETKFDTIVHGNNLFPKYLEPVPNTTYSTLKEFKWGNTYYWRIAPITNGVQGDWSETHEFQTWDARDKVIGTYTANKYIYLTNRWNNNSLDSSFGTAEIRIEKVPNSRNILFTEIGGHNLSKELNAQWTSSYWSVTENVYPNFAKFSMPNDSFTVVIMTNPASSTPWGYYFGGFQ
jgi:hypothetical protein